jgi:hypothetical protein
MANTGIFSGMARVISEEQKNQSDPALIREVNKLSLYQFEGAKAKIASGKIYSPEDYFKDLGQIYYLEDSLGLPRGAGGLWGSHIIQLQDLSLQSVRNGRFTWSDVDIAAKEFRESMGDFYRNDAMRDLKGASREDAENAIKTVLTWMMSQYAKGIPLAFIFLLTWLYSEERKKERFRLNSPISFLICLFLYPLIFSITLKRWLKTIGWEFYAEVELRRTKEKFLSMLSDDEIKAIKKFAESRLSLNAWKKELLGKGLTFKRSFALAMLAALICLCLYGRDSHAEILMESASVTAIDSNISRAGPMQISWDIGNVSDIETPCVLERFIQVVFLKRPDDIDFKIAGAMKKIEHIPVSGLIVRFFSKIPLLTNQQGDGNEVLEMRDSGDFCGLRSAACRFQ